MVQAGGPMRLFLRLFLLLLAGLFGSGVVASQPQRSDSSGLAEGMVRLEAGNLAEGIIGGIRNVRPTAKAATSIDATAAGATAAESAPSY
jgi:hypothetical protein